MSNAAKQTFPPSVAAELAALAEGWRRHDEIMAIVDPKGAALWLAMAALGAEMIATLRPTATPKD